MKRSSLATALLSSLIVSSSYADVHFNGFASIVAGKSKDGPLYGYDDDFSFKPESLFALQASSQLGDKLSATAQLVAKGSNDFDPDFEWAYISYDLTDQLSMSAGRMRTPFFRYSDYLDVGFAYRWIRPPQSVYDESFSKFDGISLRYYHTLGSWDSTLQVVYGGYDGELGGSDTEVEVDALAGASWTATKDWFSFRLAYYRAEVSVVSENPALTPLVAALGAYNLNSVIDNVLFNKDDADFVGVGFSIDHQNWLLDAEYTQVEIQNALSAKESQYFISAGYRLDDWVVHITYEDKDDEIPDYLLNQVPLTFQQDVNGTLVTLPLSTDPTNPNAPLLNDVINGAYLGVATEYKGYGVGARYNFHDSAAFKIDYGYRDYASGQQEQSVVALGVDLVF